MGALSFSSHRQSGSGLIEFSLAAALLLALGMGTVEIAHWMSVRQAVSLALLQAARVGAVAHGDPERMAASFEQALLPLFTPADSAARRQQLHFDEVQSSLSGPPWHIAILSPHPAAWLDFDPPPDSEPSVSTHAASTLAAAASGVPAFAATQPPRMDNDYQALQHQRHLERGWPQGRGPRSGQTIFEANTLTLALTYPHRPLLPTTRALLRLLPGGGTPYAARALGEGYLPLSRQVSLAMQSHPARWPSLASGKITAAGADAAGPPVGPPGACPSCPSGAPPGGPDEPDTPAPGGSPEPGFPLSPGFPSTPGEPGASPGPPGSSLAPPDTDLCGVALCCAG